MPAFEGDPLLLNILTFLLLSVVIPFAGIMAAGGATALCCDLYGRRNGSEGHRRLADALMEHVAPGRFVWLLLPLGLALALLCQWLLYGLANLLSAFWIAAFALLLAGAGALRLCRKSLSRSFVQVSVLGASGIFFIAASLYLVLLSETLIQRPDQLALLPRLPGIIISWHGTWRFLSLAALSVAAAGALLRWGAPRWTGGDYGRMGGGILLGAGLVLLPVLILLELQRAAPFALSTLIFVLAAVAVVQAGAVFLLLATGNERKGAAFVLTILIFPVWILMGQIGREEAQAEAIVAGTAALVDFPVIGVPTIVAAPPAAPIVDGETVFNRHCIACHRFDSRLVGPPLNEVLPKYVGNREALIGFIRAPDRVNPDYPPMPPIVLREPEYEAVASWLLQRIEE